MCRPNVVVARLIAFKFDKFMIIDIIKERSLIVRESMENVSVELPKEVLEEFLRCREGRHSWLSVSRHPASMPGEEIVTRWCDTCGALVIDIEYDGRLKPGFVQRIMSPLIGKKMSKRGE